MSLLPIFLLLQFTVLFPVSTVSGEKAEIVDAAVEGLTTTIGSMKSGFDLIALSLLGPQAELMMNTTLSIGSMVDETTNSKSQSEDYEALIEFQNRTKKIRKDMQELKYAYSTALGNTIPRWQYFTKVSIPINIMKTLNDQYLNPTIYKNATFINDYKTACKLAPGSILAYLRDRLVKSCGTAITTRDAQEIADIRADFVRIISQLQVDNKRFPDIGHYLSEFMNIYKQMNKNVLNEYLDVFDRSFNNYQEAIEALLDELRYRESIEKLKNQETPCLLRALIIIPNFKYSYVKMFVTELTSQLIEVAFIAASCANVSHNRDNESINKYVQEISGLVTEISSFTAKWLNDSLISSWPSVHNGILKESILQTVKKPGNVDGKTLEMVTYDAHSLMIQTGLPYYAYEMLIIRAVDNNYELMFERTGNHCSLTRGAFGFDIIIGRIFVKQDGRPFPLDTMRRLFDQSEYAKKLNTTIQSEMNLFYDATKKLPSIVKALKEKIGKEFITEKDFHCWAIVREWSNESCPIVDYSSSPFMRFGRLNSTNILSYSNKGPHQLCEEFRFFFFV